MGMQSKEKRPLASVETAVDEAREAKRARKAARREAATADLEQPQEAAVGDVATEEQGETAEAFRARMQIITKDGMELPDPVQTLETAPFNKKIRAALKDAGFTAPTAVQAQGWPIAVRGDDMVSVAKTGSGKTLAFLLPAFRRIVKAKMDPSAGPPVLVLAPTRELAVQIEEAAIKFGEHAGITTACIYGGVPKPPQVKAMKKQPHLVVATPGRLVDLMSENAVALESVQILVLDEADRMLDMGFEPQMDKIMAKISAERQTMLFSATWPKAVQKLATKYLKEDTVRVNIGETEDLAANKAVSQEFFPLDDDEKENKLWKILDGLKTDDKTIVFANTKRRIDKLQKIVWETGYDCVAMHGEKAQWERDEGLAKFVSGKAPLMFATDVCARGLDIKGVTHVINFDMARDVESYIHRIGRTGRAGATGTSITFFNEAYDMDCAPALAKIAEEAGQTVPNFLAKAAAKTGNGKGKNKLWRYDGAKATSQSPPASP
eukprot:gnl/TRDRNA2_/TRDRNA2_153117_c0_seq1.p1 gnl/TRDRNA2_/TRDRNA2_153117_c0~~gnl/TRDRNA2_/TRDRNA2_153117_c0_seq1.p1  ORF type:complete len:493 (-),score=122.40 gnl/TRDRNA2_/TRDRNA2_153117_c0_seq1:46-1524(-)